MSRRLCLTGLSGSGKSSVGRAVARMLGARFDDLDETIARSEGRTIAQLFAEGEPRFRAAERGALDAWLSATSGSREWSVLALGAGALIDGEWAACVARETTLVWLDGTSDELAARIGSQGSDHRPLVDDPAETRERLERMRAERADGYRRAMLRLETPAAAREAASTDEAAVTAPHRVAASLLRALYDAVPDAKERGAWSEPARPLASGDEIPLARGVTIGRGVETPDTGERVLVLDAGLPEIHARAVHARLGEVDAIRVPGGEGAKSWAQLADTWERIARTGLGRDGGVVVAGGGAVSDLAGFAAETYKRGVPLELHPTTLLAQADAALGGKNGINVAQLKNVAGSIVIPRAVHLDPLHLTTLPRAALRHGLAEVIKSGLIADPELFARVEREGASMVEGRLEALEGAVAGAARVKLAICSRDLEEGGERKLLNLGHTLGHALETATSGGARPLAHGDAVAIGMVAASHLARRCGLLGDEALPERLTSLLSKIGLPVRVELTSDLERSRLERALGADKKRAAGRAVWVLPVRIGEVALHAPAHEEIRAAIGEVVGGLNAPQATRTGGGDA